MTEREQFESWWTGDRLRYGPVNKTLAHDAFMAGMQAARAAAPADDKKLADELEEASTCLDEQFHRDAICNAMLRAAKRLRESAAAPAEPVVLPSFVRLPIERAIEAAINPVGMSVHDGKARVASDKLAYILRLFDRGLYAHPLTATTVVDHESKNVIDKCRDLLAIIHRDGGHHTEEVGIERSIADAMLVVCNDRADAPPSVRVKLLSREPTWICPPQHDGVERLKCERCGTETNTAPCPKCGHDTLTSGAVTVPDLREFAREILDEFPDLGCLDGFAVQDLAVKHGLLVAEKRTEPCGEMCHCAEYHGTDEMKEGVDCYRLHPSLFAANPIEG